jgi:archaellum biogenesis protein FlaJ (TadC family)
VDLEQKKRQNQRDYFEISVEIHADFEIISLILKKTADFLSNLYPSLSTSTGYITSTAITQIIPMTNNKHCVVPECDMLQS